MLQIYLSNHIFPKPIHYWRYDDGTNAFVQRFSIILFISSVYLVFQYTAWSTEWLPTGILDIIIGLKVLLSIFPTLACLLAFIFMYFFKLQRKK